MVGILTWDRREREMPWARTLTSRLAADEEVASHRHDFAELMWILAGSVVHRPLDAAAEDLTPGAARFLRPGDGHGLAAGGDGAVLVSASLAGPLFAELHARYAGSPGWPWPAQGPAQPMQLGPATIEALQGAVAGLPRSNQERVDAEWFVAVVMRALRRPPERSAVPRWLEQALRELPTAAGLQEGLPGLVRRCGRDPATVSRTVRRHFGCTASALVLRARIEHAGQALRLDGSPILDVAMACGFKDLGHFYRAFRAHYRTTPRAWREAAVGG